MSHGNANIFKARVSYPRDMHKKIKHASDIEERTTTLGGNRFDQQHRPNITTLQQPSNTLKPKITWTETDIFFLIFCCLVSNKFL